MARPSRDPEPPPPPPTKARLRVPLLNLIGMLSFAAIAALALLGTFGESTAVAGEAGDTMELRVAHPTRMRYGTTGVLEVRIRNSGARPLERIVVRFDRRYLAAFSNVALTPQPDRAYEVELRAVGPGEARLVSAQIQAQEYWSHRGVIEADSGSETVIVPVRTLTLP